MIRRWMFVLVVLVACLWVSSAFAAPIHDAADAGNVERIKALLKAGTDVNASNHVGMAPLQLAAI